MRGGGGLARGEIEKAFPVRLFRPNLELQPWESEISGLSISGCHP